MAEQQHRPGHQRILPHEFVDRMKREIAATGPLTGSSAAQGWPAIFSREGGQYGGPLGGRMVRVTIPHADEPLAHSGAYV